MPFWNSKFPYHRIANMQRQRSEIIQWIPTVLCPCSVNPNGADPNHVPCGGSGHLPLRGKQKNLHAMVSRYNARLQLYEAGESQVGDILVSPVARDRTIISQWDIIRIPGWEAGEPYQGDIIVIPPAPLQKVTFLNYTPRRIEQALMTTDTDVLYFREGEHFTREGQALTWLTSPPDGGDIVSVKYRPLMEYVVVDIPDIRHERGSDIGQRILARRRHMLRTINEPMPFSQVL